MRVYVALGFACFYAAWNTQKHPKHAYLQTPPHKDRKIPIWREGGKGVPKHSQTSRLQKGTASGADPRPMHAGQPKWH